MPVKNLVKPIFYKWTRKELNPLISDLVAPYILDNPKNVTALLQTMQYRYGITECRLMSIEQLFDLWMLLANSLHAYRRKSRHINNNEAEITSTRPVHAPRVRGGESRAGYRGYNGKS